MKAIAIIAEYNPFHNGHLYQIKKIKEKFPDHLIIAIMSGQFTQRGEPAFVSKFQRAHMAIAHCDLVVELPQFYALSFADDFAHGGITVAKLLNADILSFGSEQNNLSQLQITAQQINNKTLNRSDAGYATLMDTNLKSNDILAVQYIRQAERIYPEIDMLPIERINNDYRDEHLSGTISSATAIRRAHEENSIYHHAIPAASADFISHTLNKKRLFLLIKYAVIQKDIDELKQIYTMYEGLEYRLKKYIHEAQCYEHYIELLSTKRYSKARIRRLLSYVLLNIKETDKHPEINALRILAMNENGRQYLKTIKQNCSVPVITNLSRANHHYFSLETKATEIYNLISDCELTDFNTPVIIKRP
ncbi:tRNA(Met) cytidine acetate ligase [Macrococcus armenti]|uniref:tRNA(Met) cytidine acetate ligase n=1 Tax=Macrococcus armenti TaxID=2875764 RepID=UPI001CCF879E|nr:nucleotidyltransferase family protein [Macrococcus armenti]UBH09440.1 nucleotidyltransferase family protein [Macrococcus armenti]UBH11733.1 nucleotidyltransferase family protein [Macrococcus armenti]UBH16205.1 nucleotidyltransferase family protein [Macrococcus armenti]UBH18565.1 nucleotidyltransferase family protein [Macrococcus armenti]UBH20832.1 nucleotidyltransferase family protein [Macrococcus armenti]